MQLIPYSIYILLEDFVCVLVTFNSLQNIVYNAGIS